MANEVKWRTVGIGIGAAVLVALGGSWAAGATGVFDRPAPEPTAVVQVEQARSFETAPVHPTPTPAAVVAPVVEAPPVEAAPVEEAPVGPDLCPAGTTANSSDGYNDLSCMPDVCLTLRGFPDPAYPECDYFYPPSYYR